MGTPHTARADIAAFDTIADRFDIAATLVEGAARSRLLFDGASAGRAHPVHGDQLRRNLDAVLVDLNAWARAGAEIAAALRVGGRRYRDADQMAADGIR